MLDPTVLPVTRSDADNTGMTSSKLPLLATGTFMLDINESTTLDPLSRKLDSDPSRVATDRDVL
jgi:hypothetical protein